MHLTRVYFGEPDRLHVILNTAPIVNQSAVSLFESVFLSDAVKAKQLYDHLKELGSTPAFGGLVHELDLVVVPVGGKGHYQIEYLCPDPIDGKIFLDWMPRD